MKIEETNKAKVVTLDTLKDGDVFTVCDTFYMKTSGPKFNAVNLKDGQLKEFYHDAIVTPVDASLKVFI